MKTPAFAVPILEEGRQVPFGMGMEAILRGLSDQELEMLYRHGMDAKQREETTWTLIVAERIRRQTAPIKLVTLNAR